MTGVKTDDFTKMIGTWSYHICLFSRVITEHDKSDNFVTVKETRQSYKTDVFSHGFIYSTQLACRDNR